MQVYTNKDWIKAEQVTTSQYNSEFSQESNTSKGMEGHFIWNLLELNLVEYNIIDTNSIGVQDNMAPRRRRPFWSDGVEAVHLRGAKPSLSPVQRTFPISARCVTSTYFVINRQAVRRSENFLDFYAS